MTTLRFVADRNTCVRAAVPDWQTQLDAIWAILAAHPTTAAAVAADPTYQKILAAKAKFPKNPS